MVPAIVSDIIALPGWNGPMLLLLAKATLILVAALGITVAMQRGSAGARHLVWLATLAIVLLVPAEGFSKNTIQCIRAGLSERLGLDVAIDIQVVRDIPPEPSGKYRYVVSKLTKSG